MQQGVPAWHDSKVPLLRYTNTSRDSSVLVHARLPTSASSKRHSCSQALRAHTGSSYETEFGHAMFRLVG